MRGESMCVGNGRLYGYGISIGCGYIGPLLLDGSEVPGPPAWGCSGYGGGGDRWLFLDAPYVLGRSARTVGERGKCSPFTRVSVPREGVEGGARKRT